MPTTLSHEQLLTLARHGAQARLNEIRYEIAAIERAFGRAGRRGPKPGGATRARSQTRAKGRTKRRRSWSAAARKAAADRMRAYWAKRRARRKK